MVVHASNLAPMADRMPWCGRPFLVSRLFDVPSIGVDSLPWAVLVAIALGLLALLSLHLRTR